MANKLFSMKAGHFETRGLHRYGNIGYYTIVVTAKTEHRAIKLATKSLKDIPKEIRITDHGVEVYIDSVKELAIVGDCEEKAYIVESFEH